MRLVFLGKGGSGKTTLSSLVALHCIQSGRSTLTIDGDVNIHLGPALHVPSSSPTLSDDYSELFRALEGSHPYYQSTQIAPGCGSLPPTRWSTRISLNKDNPVLKQFAWTAEDKPWWHVKLGNYGEVDSGGDCYHFKQNALELFVHRIDDLKDEVVMTDATAGVDHLATSLVRGYDLCVFSVEPTQKSVSVARDFLSLAEQAGLAAIFIGNKIEGEEDLAFISKNLGRGLFGSVPFIPELGRSDDHDYSLLLNQSVQLRSLFDAILEHGAERFAFRSEQVEQLHGIFRKECLGYWNSYLGIDLLPYLDEVH